MVHFAPELVVHFAPELVVHFAPELVVHFTPELVVHFTPEYSADFFTSLNNVRTTIATDLYTYKWGVGSRILPGEYVQLNLVNVKKGSHDAYEKLLETLKPVLEECIKAGELKGFNVWKRTYATNISESDYTVSFTFTTVDQALSWASGKTGMADEYKKVYPKDDITNFSTKLNELRDVVSQEVWELVDITD